MSSNEIWGLPSPSYMPLIEDMRSLSSGNNRFLRSVRKYSLADVFNCCYQCCLEEEMDYFLLNLTLICLALSFIYIFFFLNKEVLAKPLPTIYQQSWLTGEVSVG